MMVSCTALLCTSLLLLHATLVQSYSAGTFQVHLQQSLSAVHPDQWAHECSGGRSCAR